VSVSAGTNTDTQALSTVSDPPASSLNDGAVESTARLRDVNFCEADKSLLVNIMNGPTFGNGAISYFSVICSREIDRVTMEKKSQAWSEITQVFNSRSLVPRRTRQLRLLWKKLRMRSNNAGHRALVSSSSRRFEFANRRNAFSRSSGEEKNAFFIPFFQKVFHSPHIQFFSLRHFDHLSEIAVGKLRLFFRFQIFFMAEKSITTESALNVGQ